MLVKFAICSPSPRQLQEPGFIVSAQCSRSLPPLDSSLPQCTRHITAILIFPKHHAFSKYMHPSYLSLPHQTTLQNGHSSLISTSLVLSKTPKPLQPVWALLSALYSFCLSAFLQSAQKELQVHAEEGCVCQGKMFMESHGIVSVSHQSLAQWHRDWLIYVTT